MPAYDSRHSRDGLYFGLLIVGVIVAIVAVITVFAGATFAKTDAIHVACIYDGGPLDDKQYRGHSEPGSGRSWQGMFSDIQEYPINVRQYDESDGLKPIAVKVRGIPMTFSPSISFTISSTEDSEGKPAGCSLIERHLRPLGATDFNDDIQRDANGKVIAPGWVAEFLNVRIQKVVTDVGTRVLQQYDPTKLTFNTDGERDQAAKEFSEKLSAGTREALGGAFFCSPNYVFGSETCGNMAVLLPEPSMAEEDAKLLAAPQRAQTVANNEIAVAREDARKASEVADQRELEAAESERLATAEEKLAEEQGRVNQAQIVNDYAWCAHVASLGQRCDLVKAAENNDYPDVVTGADTPVAVVPPAGE